MAPLAPIATQPMEPIDEQVEEAEEAASGPRPIGSIPSSVCAPVWAGCAASGSTAARAPRAPALWRDQSDDACYSDGERTNEVRPALSLPLIGTAEIPQLPA